MPNHITNNIAFVGETNDVKEVIEILTNKDNDVESEITFDNFLPIPKELCGTTSPGKPNEALIKEFGASNWYDWALLNYGTKWGAYEGMLVDDNNITFLTAWATPYPAMLKLSEKYPNVTINVEYADEDFGSNLGEYSLKGGKLLSEVEYEYGTLESVKFALEILGGADYYFGEYFEDNYTNLEELKKSDDKMTKNLLQLMYNEKVENFENDFVKDYLLEMAVAEEDYEYATTLK